MADQFDILRAQYSDRIIAFHPILARCFGGINEAILFQQIAFWTGKGRDPEWIYKTQKELEKETTLTRTQQENARRRLRGLGILEETKRGVPAKLFYRLNWPRAFALLREYVDTHESIDTLYPSPESLMESQDAGNLQTSLQDTSKDAGNLRTGMGKTREQGRRKAAHQHGVRTQSITESTQRETSRDDIRILENSKGPSPSEKDAEAREALVGYAIDYAREFRDEAKLASTLSRLVKLYHRSELDIDAFIAVMKNARVETLVNSGSIQKESSAGVGYSRKNKTPYFFGVLEGMLGLKPPHRQSGD